MIKLQRLDNRFIRVIADPFEVSTVSHILSFQDPKPESSESFRSGEWDGWHRLLQEDNTFPSGLIKFVRQRLSDMQIPHEEEGFEPLVLFEQPFTPEEFFIDRVLYDFQCLAIHKALLLKSGIVKVPTGGGKTLIGLGLYLQLKKTNPAIKCIFVVNRTRMVKQTSREALVRGLSAEEIGVYHGGLKQPDKPLVIALIASLYSGLRRGDTECLKMMEECTYLCMDEVHHLPSQSWSKVALAINAEYRLFLSATPFQDLELNLSNIRDIFLLSISGDLILDISYRSLRDRGILANCIIHTVKVSLPIIPRSKTSWTDVERAGLYENTFLYTQLINLIQILNSRGYKVLVLVARTKYGIKIVDSLQQIGVESRYSYGGERIYNSDDEEGDEPEAVDEVHDAFNRGEFNVLVGSPVYYEAIDLPEVNAVVLGAGGKSSQNAIQRVGRGLRKKAGSNEVRVFDFNLDIHHYLRSHYNKRKAVYLKQEYDLREEPHHMLEIFSEEEMRRVLLL